MVKIIMVRIHTDLQFYQWEIRTSVILAVVVWCLNDKVKFVSFGVLINMMRALQVRKVFIMNRIKAIL